MGKKADAAKASLAAAFLAAGGVVASQASAATSSGNPEAVVSSYFGPMGLQDDFQHYMKWDVYLKYYVKYDLKFDSFLKFFKFDPGAARQAVRDFSSENEIAPPPGFGKEYE